MKVRRLSLAKFKQQAQEAHATDGDTPNEQRCLLAKAYASQVEKDVEEPDSMILQFSISTGDVDRENDRINPEGWELENFRRGGSVLWAHDGRAPPVAKPLGVWIEQGALKSRAEFTAPEIYEFGALVHRLYKGGFLRAVSVGFLPKEWSFVEDRGAWAVDFARQELLEFSAVPVPANPHALIEAGKSLGDLGLLYDWSEKALDGATKIYVPREQVEDLRKALKPGWGPALPKSKADVGEEFYEIVDDDETHKTTISFDAAHPDGTPLADRDDEWDGPAEVAAAEVDDLAVMSAWVDSENDDTKQAYKLPHHRASGEHALVWRGLTAAMGALLGARGGVDVPEDDRRGIYDHLAKHYGEFDEEPPEFRDADAEDERSVDSEESVGAPAGPITPTSGGSIPSLATSLPDADAACAALVELAAVAIEHTKAGRVLSAANEEKLRQASELLAEVLAQVAAGDDEDDEKDIIEFVGFEEKDEETLEVDMTAEEFAASIEGLLYEKLITPMTGRLP